MVKVKTVECAWCGQMFETDARNNHTTFLCSYDCRRLHRRELAQKRREAYGKNPVNKEESYIRKVTNAERKKREQHQNDPTIWNSNYAERQKQKTLEMIGSIKK